MLTESEDNNSFDTSSGLILTILSEHEDNFLSESHDDNNKFILMEEFSTQRENKENGENISTK